MVSKRLYGRRSNDKFERDAIREQVLKERDEQLLHQFEQRKSQRESQKSSQKLLSFAGALSKSAFDLSLSQDAETQANNVAEPHLIRPQPTEPPIRSQSTEESRKNGLRKDYRSISNTDLQKSSNELQALIEIHKPTLSFRERKEPVLDG